MSGENVRDQCPAAISMSGGIIRLGLPKREVFYFIFHSVCFKLPSLTGCSRASIRCYYHKKVKMDISGSSLRARTRRLNPQCRHHGFIM
jgi:hypothetical protein